MNRSAFISAYLDAVRIGQWRGSALLLADLPARQWAAVAVSGPSFSSNARRLFCVRYGLDALTQPDFYPEHALRIGGAGGVFDGRQPHDHRLYVRMAVSFSEREVVLTNRIERHAYTREFEFSAIPAVGDVAEASEVASSVSRLLLRGFDSYRHHLKEMHPEEWARLAPLAAKERD